MAAYTPPTISNYNDDPAPDDGTQTADNEITWAKIKDELTDPTAVYANAINSAVASAFDNINTDVGFSAKDCSLSPATDTWTQLIFDVESRDPDSNYASSAYTCPTDGVYQFNAAVEYNTMQADSGPTEIAIYLNGSRYRSTAGAFNASAGVERVDAHISISDEFSSGDVITAYTRHQGAATEAIDDALDQVWFNGHRIVNLD